MNQRRDWLKFRKMWLKENPPNHQGAWVCGICNKWVYEGEMELDHIKPQGWTHAGKYDLDNLQPTHARCNREKGSQRDYKAWYNKGIISGDTNENS